MATPQRASVLVADAEPVARFGLVHLINSHARLHVCAEAGTVALAREACARWKPAVVVLDPQLCGGEGFTLLKDLPRWSAKSRVVVFTSLEDPGSVQRAFQCGACAYVTRGDPVEQVVRAVLGALSDERHVGPRVEHLLLHHLSMGGMEVRGRVESVLTERELQIFQLLGRGHATRAMAMELKVSVKTIETHTQRMKVKLGLQNGAELRREAALFAGKR